MARRRAHPLETHEQRSFVCHHLPGRMEAIEYHLSRPHRTYGDLAVAALFARALCSFMGIRVGRDGNLAPDRTYFEHADGKSWEVKIRDLGGGRFLRVGDLAQDQQKTLARGLREANVAFAHLTFWPDAKSQNSQAHATDHAKRAQARTIEDFARSAVNLCRACLQTTTVI